MEDVGLRFIAPGAEEFLAAVREGAQAQERITAATKGAAAGLTGVDTAARRGASGLTALGGSAAKAKGELTGLGSGARMAAGDLGGMIKGAIGVSAAIGAIKGTVELAQVAAGAEAARASFDRMAQGAGTSGKALLASLQQAAGGTVANTALIQNTNTALLLLGNDVATKLPALLQVARASAQATGQDVGYVFQSLVTGISRGSTELIDNAGITLSATEAYNTYAASIGKSADQLTKAERSQAILNGVLTAGQSIVAQSGTSADSNAAAMQRATAAIDNFKVALGERLLPIVGTVANALTQVLSVGEKVAETQDKLAQVTLGAGASYEQYAEKITSVNDQLSAIGQHIEPLSQGQYRYAQSLVAGGMAADEATTKAAALNDVQQVLAGNTGLLVGTTQQQRDALAALAPEIFAVAGASDTNKAAVLELIRVFTAGGLSSDQLAAALTNQAAIHAQAEQAAAAEAAAQEHRRGEITMGTAATEANTGATTTNVGALVEQTAASQQAALEAEKLEKFQTDLANLAGSVASGHRSVGAAANVLANQWNIAYSEALKLISAQLQLARLGGAGGGKSSTGGGSWRTGALGIVTTASGAQTRIGVGVGGVVSDAQSAAIEKARQAAERKARGTGAGGSGRGAGGAGAGGAGAGAAAAQKSVDLARDTAAKRQEIARTAGEKLQGIERATGEKLLAIDQQYAQRRLEAIRKLNEQIAGDAANINFSQILNNFDLLNAKLTEEQRAALNEREAAEATYQQSVAAAAEEARQIAADGDAEYAQAYYATKKEQAERQRQIDERAAQATREAGEDQQQAVQDTAAAATAANEAAANNDIAVAQAAAEARKKAKEDEKTKVIADAQEQSQAVILAAQEQERQLVDASTRAAGKIKGASAETTAAVVAGFNAQADAANRATDAVNTYNSAVASTGAPGGAATGSTGGTSGGTTAAAGGGSFVTSGPSKFVAGDNPGGVEVVTVTPISGVGTTRVGRGVAHFGGGGAMVTGLPTPAGNGKSIAQLNAEYAALVAAALAAADATTALSLATRVAGQQALDTAAKQAVQDEQTKRIEATTTGALRSFLLLNPAITESGVDAMVASRQLTVQAATLIKGELATRRMAVATRESAAASLVDAARKRQQEASTKLMEQQVQAAADAFLTLNPSIDEAAIASLVAAGNIDPLVAQLVAVEQQARKAEQALVSLQTTATKSYTPDNGPLNFYQAQIDAQRALADATQYLAELRSDTEVKARQTEADEAAKAQQAVEDEYAQKRKEIMEASDFENDAYDEQGNLVKGRLSKLRDLENEYRQDREDAANAVLEAEKALAAERQRVATNAQTALALQQQLSTAQQQAERIRATDEAAAASYLQLRTQQLTEVADLERERADLAAQAALGDEGAKIQLAALDARLAAIKKAQEGELLLWREQQRQQVIAGIASARGIEEGMVEATPELLAEVNRIMEAIIAATNQQLDIHSPSRVMKRRGMLAIEGLTGGISDPRSLAALRAATRETVAAIPAAVTPPMSATQQAMTSSSYVDQSINGIDARGSNWTEAQLRAIVNSALDARTQRGYGIRATGGYGRQ